MRRHKPPRLRPRQPVSQPGQPLIAQRVDSHARPQIGDSRADGEARPQFSNVDALAPGVSPVDEQPARPVQVVPLRLERALGVEDLDTVILPIRHVQVSLAINADVVRKIELPGVGAGLSPGEQVPPLRRELVDAGVPIAIGDVERAVLRHRQMRAPVERLAAVERRRSAGTSDGEQDRSLERALPDGVVAVVGEVDRVVRAHRHRVGPREEALAPGALEASVAVEDDHGVRAAGEHKDAVSAVHPDAGDLPEGPPLGEPGPVLYHLEDELAAAHPRHGSPHGASGRGDADPGAPGPGFLARMNALTNFPSTSGATAAASMPTRERNSPASATR